LGIGDIMAQLKNTEIQIFAGGLKLKPVAHLINKEDARYASNLDLRKGNLTPLPIPLFHESAEEEYFYYFDDKFFYFSQWRSNLLYNNVWYSADIRGTYKRKEGDLEESPLGINPPTVPLILGTPTPPIEGDGLTGYINYVYTYYDPDTGSESPPSPPTVSVNLTEAEAGQAIPIGGIVPSPQGFESRLYRLGSTGITAYSAVITLDNAVVTYTDELKFSQIEGMILSTLRAYPPLPGLQYLTEHLGRFYGAVGSKLYFSAVGKPDSWFELDYISFNKAITMIASVANGLIVASRDKAWLISGSQPQTFSKHTLSDSMGCVNMASLATADGRAVWLSDSGFVLSSGASVTNISLSKLGRFNTLTPFGAAILDERYYMSFGGSLLPSNTLYPSEDLYPNVVTGEAGTNLPAGAIIIDLGVGEPVISSLIDIYMRGLLVSKNELYQTSTSAQERKIRVTEDGKLARVTESGRRFLEGSMAPVHSLSQVLNGGELREMHYLSPLYTDGSIGGLKQYEKIRITYVGRLNLRVVDENLKRFVEIDLEAIRKTTEWVNIPVSFNHGHGIQFKLMGKAIVDSIMYSYTDREAL